MTIPIYMDYLATTPTDERVVQAMLPYFNGKFGNPHSRSHSFGWDAENAVEEARVNVARLINAVPKEVIFTSGATESNNLALKGVAHFYGNKRNHIITASTEHKCVLESCRQLEQEGFKITYLPVQQDGLINLKQLEEAMTDETAIVSIMAVNNEIGVIQSLAEIGAICRKKGVFFHTDAAQAFGKIPLDVKEMNIDLMSISGHKIYGPKGIGALYVGRKPRVRLNSIISGGGQERGMRSGTIPTPLAVGLGTAAKIAQKEMHEERTRISKLSNKFLNTMLEIPQVFLNGSQEHRIPGCVNVSFSCIEGESMMGAIKYLAVSSGSACTSTSLEPSYVLKSLGLDEELAHTSIRFSFGRFTTDKEVDYAIKCVKNSVQKLRGLSPLWDMMQEGIDLKSVDWAAH